MIPILVSGTVQEHISVVVSHQFAATCENEDTSLLTHAQTVSSHHAWRGGGARACKGPQADGTGLGSSKKPRCALHVVLGEVRAGREPGAGGRALPGGDFDLHSA